MFVSVNIHNDFQKRIKEGGAASSVVVMPKYPSQIVVLKIIL